MHRINNCERGTETERIGWRVRLRLGRHRWRNPAANGDFPPVQTSNLPFEKLLWTRRNNRSSQAPAIGREFESASVLCLLIAHSLSSNVAARQVTVFCQCLDLHFNRFGLDSQLTLASNRTSMHAPKRMNYYRFSSVATPSRRTEASIGRLLQFLMA